MTTPETETFSLYYGKPVQPSDRLESNYYLSTLINFNKKTSSQLRRFSVSDNNYNYSAVSAAEMRRVLAKIERRSRLYLRLEWLAVTVSLLTFNCLTTIN
ncbi:MAG: hypothetical protein SAL07_06230 [Oscillatoria sp. PMC 1051.18]|nr:hypothetical protein [Oscillatoria sp. PMC 1050.18]MEC5029492.1 hypothetical protein [Oscillatoria sp. PMC 1051.18]